VNPFTSFVNIDKTNTENDCARAFAYLENKYTFILIMRPLSALSLDEGLNALNGKNPSAAVWFSRPIKCQILTRMRISDFHFFRL
jgi:hypothetical protein